MRKIFILRGAPGSGKSSFIRHNHLEPYTLSTDEIRLLHGNLQYRYDQKNHVLRQVIPQEFNGPTFELLNHLLAEKMSRGETVIVDGTHLYPNAIESYQPVIDRYRYETFVVDFMAKNSLKGLIARNEVRIKYHWVDPDVITRMVEFAKAHPDVPDWAKKISPNVFKHCIIQRERALESYEKIFLVPTDVSVEHYPKVYKKNFYFSFNDAFTARYGSYRNVVNLAVDADDLLQKFRLPFFAFKFHHKHFLVSAKHLRNELIGPVKKEKGVWFYHTGLVNLLDFVQDFPMTEKSVVQQFNLTRLEATKTLQIW